MGSKNPFGWCGGRDHAGVGSSRRDFLYVGLIGGLGLSLGDFLRSEAAASDGEIVYPGTTHPAKEGRPNRSFISSCRAEWPIRNRLIPNPLLRLNIAGRLGRSTPTDRRGLL